MQFCDLALKRSRHHPLAQALEAMHLGFHQASSVITAPLLPDTAPQPLASSQGFVAPARSLQRLSPRPCILARGNHRLRTSLRYRRVAPLCVVGSIPTDTCHRLIERYLGQQFGQHGSIAHAVVCDFNGPNLQRVGINAQVHLAPLPPIFGSVLLAFPFPFTQELDARTVHQQIQRCGAALVRKLHLQRPLTATDGAEIGNPPIQPRQTQQALNQSQALAQCQAKQALDAQAKLDGRIRERLLATPFATGRCVPLHVFVQPDRQRPSDLECGVVRSPVGGLVAGLRPLGFIHAPRLPVQWGWFVQQSRVLVPMMLMSLGARLASSQVADAWVGVRSGVLILIIRLAAVLLALWFIPLEGLERGALILFACLPSAVFNFMLADKFQVEPNKVASTVIVGHLLSLAFLPLGIWLAFI